MTYREKFKETFGFEPDSDYICNVVKCEGYCETCKINHVSWGDEYIAPTVYHGGDPVTFKNSLAIYKYDLNGKAVITYLYEDMLINEAVEYKDIKKLGGAKNG